jgi:hypothetical protein
MIPILVGEGPLLPRRKGGVHERLVNLYNYIGLSLGLLEWVNRNPPRKPTRMLGHNPARREMLFPCFVLDGHVVFKSSDH